MLNQFGIDAAFQQHGRAGMPVSMQVPDASRQPMPPQEFLITGTKAIVCTPLTGVGAAKYEAVLRKVKMIQIVQILLPVQQLPAHNGRHGDGTKE